MSTRDLVVGIVVALAAYFLYMALYTRYLAPKPPATQPALGPSSASVGSAASDTRPAMPLTVAGGDDPSECVLGAADDALRLRLTPRGAAVSRVELTTRRGEKFAYREHAAGNEPHVVLHPLREGDSERYSYATSQIIVDGSSTYALDQLLWTRTTSDARSATFMATLNGADGAPELRISKTYRLAQAAPLVEMNLAVENVGAREHKVGIRQDGPIGIPEEGRMYATRRVMAVHRLKDGTAEMAAHARTALKAPILIAASAHDAYFAWGALTNKYFGVFTRPVTADRAAADSIAAVSAELATPGVATDLGDLRLQMITRPMDLAAGQRCDFRFEIYAGPKDSGVLAKVDPRFADRAQIGYVISHDADKMGCCAFCTWEWLTLSMAWLLQTASAVFRNYGVAIIILVIIVRTLMHPMAVFQQRSMYRFQEAMVKLQPKLEAVKAKFADDPARAQQEQMKVYGEEGVNPLAPMVGMLPLFIQMPILMALWTALYSDVHLRHAPFDGWWIRDLSAPDAFISFATPLTIPVLGQIPFLGVAFQNIESINLLPILMGVSMFLQQKYMPKPAMAQRTQQAQEQKAAGGKSSIEDQMRQQQMMANMMSIMFPVMFYYTPSGLSLYWMATNVFGICESLIIRRQIAAEKKRREALGPQPVVPKKPGVVAKLFKYLADQAEQVQKRADEVSREPGKSKKDKK